MKQINVLVADSQHLFAETLAASLKVSPGLSVVDCLPESGAATIDAIELWRPDVCLMDYWMTGMEGPAATSRIRRAVPDCKVILLSWFHGPGDVQFAFASGAVGFLPKSVGVHEVVEAIRQAHAGELPVLKEGHEKLVKKLESRWAKSAVVLQRLEGLTPRELEILTMLSYGGSIVEVAKQLFISPKTLRNHISNILAKTGATSHTQAVAMARYCGLIQT